MLALFGEDGIRACSTGNRRSTLARLQRKAFSAANPSASVWNFIGLAASLAVAAIAWRRSRGRGGFYDDGVYAMTPAVHRRYAIVSLAFAAFFATALALRREPAGVVGLALYAVVAVFYAASFLRGAADYDE
ncbi:MAG: hypothetical protein ABI231_06545 [Candidatus Tumulicola sp.]